MGGNVYGRSCTPTLRRIPSPPKPGQLPPLQALWRGPGPGLASCVRPTRAVGAPLALCQSVSPGGHTRAAPPPGPAPPTRQRSTEPQAVEGLTPPPPGALWEPETPPAPAPPPP